MCWDVEGSGQSWLDRLSKQRIYSLGWNVLRRKNISDISRLILKEELIIWFCSYSHPFSCLQMYSDSHALSQSVSVEEVQYWTKVMPNAWEEFETDAADSLFSQFYLRSKYYILMHRNDVCITSRVSIHLFLFCKFDKSSAMLTSYCR